MRFLRPEDVAEKIGLSKAELYRLIKSGMFPRPVKILSNVSVWLDKEVEDIMYAMYRHANLEEIRDLVKKLEESRNNSNPLDS